MNGDKNIITAYIGLGSNIGDRKKNIDSAIEMLNSADDITVSAVSTYINTPPVGYTDQPDFLNAVVELKTTLSPQKLLAVCQDTERELKRVRVVKWGPRTIDLDILLYGEAVLDDENLIIPHPRMHEREFVMKPLKEIAPQAFHPVLEQTAGDIYKGLTET